MARGPWLDLFILARVVNRQLRCWTTPSSCPDDYRMHAAAETRIGGCNNALAVGDLGNRDEALSDRLRMLDDICGLTDIVAGKLDALSYSPLALVSDVPDLNE